MFIGGKYDRSAASRAGYKKMDRNKMMIALASEQDMTGVLGGDNLPDNEPFDVVKKNDVFEIKTLIDPTAQDRVNMHVDSRMRKAEFAGEHGVNQHLIAVDKRGSRTQYY